MQTRLNAIHIDSNGVKLLLIARQTKTIFHINCLNITHDNIVEIS